MQCRKLCGACCIAPSIVSPLPGMPDGKPAGDPCINLDSVDFSCKIWDENNYPSACKRFLPSPETCGENRDQALDLINSLEISTAPS